MTKLQYGFRATIQTFTESGAPEAVSMTEYGSTDRDFALAANKVMEMIWRFCLLFQLDYRSAVVQFWKSGNLRKGFTYRFVKDAKTVGVVSLDNYLIHQLPLLDDDTKKTPLEQR